MSSLEVTPLRADLPPLKQATFTDGNSVSTLTNTITTPNRIKTRPPLTQEFRSKSDFYPAFTTIKEESSCKWTKLSSHSSPSSPSGAEDSQFMVLQRPFSRRNNSNRSSEPSPASESINPFLAPGPGPYVLSGKVVIEKRRSRPSSGWSRTTSGGSFFDRSSSGRDVSNSSSETWKGKRRIEAGIKAIEPLRPPSRTRLVASQPEMPNRVRIEKSFTKLPQPTSKNSSSSRPIMINSFTRLSSVLPRLQNLGVKKKRKRRQKCVPGQSLFPGAQNPRTGWRRDHISIGLPRVSILLADFKAKLAGRNSPCSDLSPSSRTSSGRAEALPPSCPPNEPFSHRPRSMELISNQDSADSSLPELQGGSQLQNTPEDKATYRIKRSPSSATEEFLKIDISVPGGTSYLPSEARRIHTPPLPKDRPDGHRRGFFFDYNPVSVVNENRTAFSAQNASTRPQLIRSSKFKPTVPKRAATVSDRSAARRPCRAKTGDWYGTQLAELDVLSDDETAFNYKYSLDDNRPRACTLSAESRPCWDKELLDLTIPDHLPTSPLCPRHPRYWRVVKSKGSQFRGCWMHGYGEYTLVEISEHCRASRTLRCGWHYG